MSGGIARLLRDGALWGGAGALVLVLHLGGALWILPRAKDAAPPGLPEPIFIDLAPVEEATIPAATPDEPAKAPPLPPAPEPTPQPDRVAEPLELPPLPELQPVDDMAALFPPAPAEVQTPPVMALNRSARPQRRPERVPEPEPQRQAETRKQRPAPERQAQTEPHSAPTAAPQPPARRAQQGAGGTGATSPSAQQVASLIAQWGGQIRSCISRRAAAPRGVREGGRVVLTLSVARSGAIQRVGLGGSSGNAALDQTALQAAQRAGRCPRAPAGLSEASYSFQLPINLQVR